MRKDKFIQKNRSKRDLREVRTRTKRRERCAPPFESWLERDPRLLLHDATQKMDFATEPRQCRFTPPPPHVLQNLYLIALTGDNSARGSDFGGLIGDFGRCGFRKKVLYNHYFFLIRLQECSAPVIVCAKELSKLANAIGKTHNQPNWHEQ